jgi:hypothetical protein
MDTAGQLVSGPADRGASARAVAVVRPRPKVKAREPLVDGCGI